MLDELHELPVREEHVTSGSTVATDVQKVGSHSECNSHGKDGPPQRMVSPMQGILQPWTPATSQYLG